MEEVPLNTDFALTMIQRLENLSCRVSTAEFLNVTTFNPMKVGPQTASSIAYSILKHIQQSPKNCAFHEICDVISIDLEEASTVDSYLHIKSM